MKVFLALGLILGGIVSYEAYGTKPKVRKPTTTVEQRLGGIELRLVSHKRNYKRSEHLKLDVMLKNFRNDDVYVFGILEWGHSASLILHVRDASGKEIEPDFLFDAQTYARPDEKEAFLKIRSNHMLGTTFVAPLKFLSLTKPGRYSLFAEYNSPFSTSEIELRPFLGKESGPIKSNVVWIEVVR